MLRAVLLYGFLLLLPFMLYAGYLHLIIRKRQQEGPGWSEAPLTWLLIGGLALIGAGMVTTAYLIGEDPDGAYVPAHMEGGKLVPGEVR